MFYKILSISLYNKSQKKKKKNIKIETLNFFYYIELILRNINFTFDLYTSVINSDTNFVFKNVH